MSGPAVREEVGILRKARSLAGEDLNRADTQVERTPAIAFQNVSKSYAKGKAALSDVSFDVRCGSVTALIGPNGAGKTTSLKIMVGLTGQTSGSVEILGRPVAYGSPELRRNVGYVGQNVSLDSTSNVTENLSLQAALFGLDRQSKTKRIDCLIESFEMTSFADRRIMSLSGGQKRRVDIAMALVHEPELLVLDEPTVNLDVDAVREVWRHLETMRSERGFTIIFSTHNLEQAERHADEILFINRGALVAQGSPTKLMGLISGDAVLFNCRNANAAARGCIALEASEEAREVSVRGDDILAIVDDGPRAVPRLAAILTGAGIDVEQIEVSRPSLDEVYSRLTGEDFAESDAAGAEPPVPQMGGFYR